jgi:hypothetical protein
MTKPGYSKTRERIDAGEMRDKVKAPDPAAAPMDTDNEAAGAPTPAAVADAADREQAAAAQRAVPESDKSRAESAPDPDDTIGTRRRPETFWTPPRG